MISPLLKKGKDASDTKSFRPISLTSCVGKTLERIINNRLQADLEDRHIVCPEQAGFRKLHSTEDQLLRLSQQV